MVRVGTGYLTPTGHVGGFADAAIYRQYGQAAGMCFNTRGLVIPAMYGCIWSYLRAERVEHDAQKGAGS